MLQGTSPDTHLSRYAFDEVLHEQMLAPQQNLNHVWLGSEYASVHKKVMKKCCVLLFSNYSIKRNQ